jgi:hypothetical protein
VLCVKAIETKFAKALARSLLVFLLFLTSAVVSTKVIRTLTLTLTLTLSAVVCTTSPTPR